MVRFTHESARRQFGEIVMRPRARTVRHPALRRQTVDLNESIPGATIKGIAPGTST
ncbi:hypothetical protein BDB13_3260 [Rhodococcus sp. OK302]|nr:hypothetical protein BDB13_3260 [Rhodococcus sp. OK302]